MILHQGALKKSRFLRGWGGGMQLQETKLSLNLIDSIHSRGLHLCKFIGTKECICIRKEFNSLRISLGHQHGRHFIILGHQYGHRDVMCLLSILQSVSHVYFLSLSILFLLWKGVGGCVITTSSFSVLHPSINQS